MKERKDTYTQCLFVSTDHDGSEPCAQGVQAVPAPGQVTERHWEYVAWIPTMAAVKDRLVTIDGLTGAWRIAELWGTRPARWVEDKSWDHMRQRKASDI